MNESLLITEMAISPDLMMNPPKRLQRYTRLLLPKTPLKKKETLFNN